MKNEYVKYNLTRNLFSQLKPPYHKGFKVLHMTLSLELHMLVIVKPKNTFPNFTGISSRSGIMPGHVQVGLNIPSLAKKEPC